MQKHKKYNTNEASSMQTRLTETSETIETATETAEVLTLPQETSQIKKEMMLFEQIAEKLEKIVKPIIVSDTIDQSKISSLSVDELKQKLESLPAEAGNLIKQTELLLQEAQPVFQQIKQSKFDSESDLTKLNAFIEAILSKIQNIKYNIVNISLRKSNAQTLSPIYIQKKIEESEFKSMDDFEQKLSQIEKEYWDTDKEEWKEEKRFFGLNRIFSKFKKDSNVNLLKQKKESINKELTPLKSLKQNINHFKYFEINVPTLSDTAIQESLMTLACDTLITLVPEIQKQYDLYLQEAVPIREKKQEDILTPELIDQLNDEFIQKYVHPEIEKNKKQILEECRNSEEDNQKRINQAIEILKRSFAIHFKVYYPPAEQEEYQKAEQIRNDLNSLFPYTLRAIIEKYVDYQKEKSFNDEYQTIANFLTALPLLLKRQEIISSYQQISDRFKNAISSYSLPYEVRNMEHKLNEKQRELQLDDSNKLLKNFIYEFNPRSWEICKNSQEFQRLFFEQKQLSIEQLEDSLGEILLQEYLRVFRDGGYSVAWRVGSKLQNIKTAETIPFAVFHAYFEPHYLYSGEDTGFYQFCSELADEQIGQLKKKKIPGIVEIIGLIKKNPENFQDQQIENPQLLKFSEQLKNDDEFLDFRGDYLYGEVENFALLPAGYDQDTNYHYDEKIRTFYISKQVIEQSFPEFSNLIDMPFSKTDELFVKFKKALVKDGLRDVCIEKNQRQDVKETTWDSKWIDDKKQRLFLLPTEEADKFLAKFGYDINLFQNRSIDNPVYLEIRQKLVKMAMFYFAKGENAQNYLLEFLEKLNIDLGPECYQEIAKLFSESDWRSSDKIVNFAINRITTQQDDRAAVMLLRDYAQDEEAVWKKERLQQIKGYLVGVFVNKEIDQESLVGLSQILSKTAEEINQTLSFITELQKLGYSYKSEKCNDYFELAKQPDTLSFIQNLHRFGYIFSIEHASLYPDLAARKTEFISQIQDIQTVFPHFRYNPRLIYSYNFETKQTENFFATEDPYELLPTQITGEQLFQGFYQKQKEQGFLDRKFSDGFMRSLRTNDPTYQNQPDKQQKASEQEYQTFNIGLEKLLNGLYVSEEDAKELFEKKYQTAVQVIQGEHYFYDQRVLHLMARQPELIEKIKEIVPLCLNKEEKIQEFILQNLERLTAVPQEKIPAYIEIAQKIDVSNSQEIQRIKEALIAEILNTDDPVGSYEKIEHTFVHNLLPSFAKAFKIFEALHSVKEIQRKTRNQGSPVIRRVLGRGANERNYQVILRILYRDLLNIHLLSANRSLREYAELLLAGEEILNKAEKAGIENLDEVKQEELNYFLSRLETLLISSFLGQRIKAKINIKIPLEARYQHLRESFEVQEGQTVIQRINEIFLKPAGLRNLQEVLEKMKGVKKEADERGRALADSSPSGCLEIKEGDLLKGVDIQFISNILQGPVCKEFLGPFMTTDLTPLDTDVSQVLAEDLNDGFHGAMLRSLAQGYGRLVLVLRDRGQFQTTKIEQADYKPKKLELFQINGRHYGIRTGFPATQIEFMIAKDDLIQDKRALEKIYYEIAQNGYYLPVADTQGRIIFTPGMYDEYRKVFAGLDRFDGQDFQFLPTLKTDVHFKQIQEIISEIPLNIKKTGILSQQIRSGVRSALKENGIRFRGRADDPDLSGAEFLDTGSTGRGTNVPGEQPDFDFILKLDAGDFSQTNQIAEKIKNKFSFQGQAPLVAQRDNFQLLTLANITEIETEEGKKKIEPPIEKIDLGFVKKSELAVFGSHNAIEDKLEWTDKKIGHNAYEQVMANIILAKMILKAGEAYSRQKQGGWGGIGTENWILANNGNMLAAFESFIRSAYDENGNLIPFEKFKEEYKILNAGMNIKLLYHDNYTDNMNKKGYEAIVRTIKISLEIMEKIQKQEMSSLNLKELMSKISEETTTSLPKDGEIKNRKR